VHHETELGDLHPSPEELALGLPVETDAEYVIVLPALVRRVRLIGMMFETDKTFLLPSAMPGMRDLRVVYESHSALHLLVSGHTDRAGGTAHNLRLSVERAQAVAAFLKDVVDDWVARYGEADRASQKWGVREDQFMLSALISDAGNPYYLGPITGISNAATVAAVSRFQAASGLPRVAIDAATRRALITGYMAIDGTSLPETATVVIHGCGESHASVETKDSVALADNRRVELFLFQGPVVPAPETPCPDGGCTQYPIWVSRSMETIDVRTDPEVAVHIVDELGLPLKRARLRITREGFVDAEELQTGDDGVARPRVPAGTAFKVVVVAAHEGGLGDALTTPSGQHFHARAV
jgi:hypothetical protein